jgi:hypothetical protein
LPGHKTHAEDGKEENPMELYSKDKPKTLGDVNQQLLRELRDISLNCSDPNTISRLSSLGARYREESGTGKSKGATFFTGQTKEAVQHLLLMMNHAREASKHDIDKLRQDHTKLFRIVLEQSMEIQGLQKRLKAAESRSR